MKYKLSRSNGFKRSYKKAKLSDDAEARYIEIVYSLLQGIPLEANTGITPLKASTLDTENAISNRISSLFIVSKETN